MNAAQLEYLPAWRRQHGNKLLDTLQFLASGDYPFRGRRIIGNGKALKVCNRVNPDDACATQLLQSNIAHRVKQVSAPIADMSGILKRDDPGIRFLNDIINIVESGYEAPQPAAHIGFVGQDMTAYPGDKLLVARGHALPTSSREPARAMPLTVTPPAL